MEDKTTTYNVIFSFSKDVPKVIENLVIQAFVEVYSDWCKMVNPMYEKWNSEYEGPNDGLDDAGTYNPDSAYNEYIRKCYEPLIAELSRKNSGMIFKRFFIGDELQLQAELYNGAILDWYLKEA